MNELSYKSFIFMPNTTLPAINKHHLFDNIQGQTFGVILIAFGMSMLHSQGLITGQIAGLAFLLSYMTGWSFAVIFSIINMPFYILAIMRLGRTFTLNTIICITAVSFLTHIFLQAIIYTSFNPLVCAILAGICIGIGTLVLFRHQASAGGVGILAVFIQEKIGFKAGWVQLIFDAILFIIACFFLEMNIIIYSLIGALVLNLLIAWNHHK